MLCTDSWKAVHFKFIADGYSAYPLAAQQFLRQFGEKFKFDITQVIGLKNDDEVSAKAKIESGITNGLAMYTA